MRSLAFVLFGVLVLVACATAPDRAQAWGKRGHLTVCDLAYRNLTDASKDALIDLMQSKSGGTTVPGRGRMPDRHYTSFNYGCLEEDAERQPPEAHFINVDRSVTSIAPDCPGGGECVLSAIQSDFATLKDKDRAREERVGALMALGHWAGDIHQPLHVSFADDRGGNKIDVMLAGRCGTAPGRPENLHSVWDNCLLESGLFERERRANPEANWGPNTITYRAVSSLQAGTSLTEERELVKGTPADWANESYRITLDPKVKYCTSVGDKCRYSPSAVTYKASLPPRRQALDQAYLANFEDDAQERVRKAGFRLAHLINQALDPNYQGPIQNSTQQP